MKSLVMVAMMLNQPGTYRGQGKDMFHGYRVTQSRDIQGTGKDMFKGWKPDGQGGYRGTGKEWGRHVVPSK